MPEIPRASSMTDVARHAGVSVQTVSNVLNTPSRVTPETMQRVLDAIQELDYTPNMAARRLRSRQSSAIAVRLDSNADGSAAHRGLYSAFIQDEFVFQLVTAAEQRGTRVIVYTAESQAAELEKLRFLLASRDVDGLILSSTIVDDPRLVLQAEMGVPFLSFGRPWGMPELFSTAHPWVDVDGRSGTAAATSMFWERGLRRIGFIGWIELPTHEEQPQSVGDDRFLGWLESMEALNPGFVMDDARRYGTFGEESVASGRECIQALLERVPDVEAVVCASDTLALGALLGSRALGARLQVCGFDNSPISREFGFSSVDQNLESVAQHALQVLMGEKGRAIRHVDFAAERMQAHVLLEPTLVVR